MTMHEHLSTAFVSAGTVGGAIATWFGLTQGLAALRRRSQTRADEARARNAEATTVIVDAAGDLVTYLRSEIDRIQHESVKAQHLLQEELENTRKLVDVLEKRLHLMTQDRDEWRGRALNLGWLPDSVPVLDELDEQ